VGGMRASHNRTVASKAPDAHSGCAPSAVSAVTHVTSSVCPRSVDRRRFVSKFLRATTGDKSQRLSGQGGVDDADDVAFLFATEDERSGVG
jgi:hypothetical protein